MRFNQTPLKVKHSKLKTPPLTPAPHLPRPLEWELALALGDDADARPQVLAALRERRPLRDDPALLAVDGVGDEHKVGGYVLYMGFALCSRCSIIE